MNRLEEVAQYAKEYQSPAYRMGEQRRIDVERLLRIVPRGALLDVSTGRGETLDIAADIGFKPVQGTEVVPDLIDGLLVVHAYAHDLPFGNGAFDTVTCFDVLEHLIEDDLLPALREFRRVAKSHIILSASEIPCAWRGRELHISRRPASDWLALIRQAMPGCEIVPSGTCGGSPCWIIHA